MMLYSLLWISLASGHDHRPDVSDQMQTVTGDGKKLVTGDRVRRLKIMRNSIFRNLTGVRL
uniref:Conjugal transfer protein n=1 Tax=Escherichia coli TaxID=562 RepID=A0A3G4RTR0_ECOLX|nr:conjugal transfer protein [Escherichia coli]